MHRWVNVTSDFDGEETAHFGPRKESGTSLYQVDTLATVSPVEKNINECPSVVSTVLGDYGCLAVSKDLSLFKDMQYSVSLSFDDVIETTDWSPDGRLLAVGTNDGKLYLLETESNKICFAPTVIPEEARKDGSAFKKIIFQERKKEKDICDVYILSSSGLVLVINNLDLSSFTKGIDNPGELVKHQIKFQKIPTYEVHTVSTTDIIPYKSSLFTFGKGDSILAKWSCENGDVELVDEVGDLFGGETGIIMAKISSDGNYIFVVDQDSTLSLWHAHMLVVINRWTDRIVSDFQLLETQELKNNSTKGMKLLVICKNNEGSTLYVQELPSLNTVYTLQLNKQTYIATCPTYQESLYVVEGCCDESYPDVISTVRFRCLNEAKPETRLSRLLNKKLFDQAEEFAKTFNLDLELVYEVKVRHILEQVAPWNSNKYSEEMIESMIKDLWTCLDLIKNDLGLVDCCLKVALPTYEETCKLLQYQKSRLIKLAGTKPSAEILQRQQNLLADVLEIQHRLLTYRMVFGVDEYNAEDWDNFMKCNLLDKSMEALAVNQHNTTFTIWQRHKTEWSKHMGYGIIDILLKNIPDDIKASDILGWYRDDLIPFVSSNVPTAMQLIVSWILLKITNMELLEKKGWPLNALEFSKSLYKKINEVLQINLGDSVSPADNANKTKVNSKQIVQPLHNMVFDLQQLYNLETKNSCRLTLAQFQQETTESVTFRMLDQIQAVELLVPALQRQIIPYLKEHDLNEDQIFAKYVKDLLERTGHIRTIMGTSLWESKTEAIINFIIDKREKCLAILNIMKIAPLPWSDEVEKLILSGLKLDHPMVAELKEQCRLVEVKKLMIKYGLSIKDIPSTDTAERLINYILHRDLPTAIEDAIQVQEALELTCDDEIYRIRSFFLIQHDRISEYIELLQSISTTLAINTGYRVVNYARLELQDKIAKLCKLYKENKLFTQAAVATANFLQSVVPDEHEKEEWRKFHKYFHNILSLQIEYKKYMTLEQYQSKTYRQKLFLAYEEQFFTTSASFNTDQTALTINQMYRLSDLLLISRVQFLSHLIVNSARNGEISAAVKWSSKLCEVEKSEETIEAILSVSQSFLQILSDCDIDTEDTRCLPQTVYQLACYALTHCSQDRISDYLELCKSAHLLSSISNECEASGLQNVQRKSRAASVSQMKDERFDSYTFDVVFKEDSLVMNSSIVIPLVANFLKVNPFLKISIGRDTKSKLEECLNAAIILIQHLKENSHLNLSIRTVMYVLSIVIQLNDMGYVKPEELELYKTQVENVHQKNTKLVKDLLSAVLNKLFNFNKVDLKLALASILSLQKKLCVDAIRKMLSSAGTNYKKLMSVATVGIGVSEIFNDPTAKQVCQNLEADGRWGHRLAKFKIQFKDALNGGSKEKLKILNQMAQSDAAEVSIIKEFCEAFNLETQDGLLMYLETVLTKESYVAEDDQKLRSRLTAATEIIEAMKEKSTLRKKLKQMLAKTSIYDYESIEFILQALSKLDTDSQISQGLALLPYLKVYKRRGQPSEEELRYGEDRDAEELSTVLGTIPAIGKTRIPYHPLVDGDAWKIITPELDSDTVSMWLPIVQVLKLKVDDVYLVAVQNMVKKHVACQKSEEKQDKDRSKCDWEFSERSIQFLNSIHALLVKVSHLNSVLACSTWLVRELPMGGEKILGLKCCVEFAEKWNMACPEAGPEKKKAMAAYTKFSTYLKRLSTERILFLHNMTEPHIVGLVNQPTELINKLYELPCVTADQLDVSIKRTDVNAMVKDIVEIHGLKLSVISTSLIEKWLPSSASKQDSDQTFNFENFNLNDQNMEMDDDDLNLKRVMYLLQKDSVKENALYLYGFACCNKTNVTNLCKARALLCLLKIVDEKTIHDELGISVEDIRHDLQIRSYLIDLDELHIQHSEKTFGECNKEGLVRGIWKNHSHQRKGILLTCALCLDYKIYDVNLWNGILKQLLSLNCLKQLEYVLVRLSASPNIWLVTNYAKAWQHLLTAPLSKVSTPLDESKTEECLHYFNLLHKCPVIDCLNLSQLARQYENLGLEVCSAGCLLLSTSSHTQDVQELLSDNKTESIKSLESLTNLGMTNIAVTQVQEAIFSLILKDEDYENIIDSTLARQFVTYIIHHDKINGLLLFALRNKRLQEAESFFKLYLNSKRDVYDTLIDYTGTSGSDNFLEAYLQLQGVTG
ncbi:hypothetical protein LOTGIDRAFT_232428 [Lottia gigantea]|uniref:Uncharacterized protein n=1 Tax=Lottia gigantea TaxID=225164 RepID=V3ZRV8_LOTGI|nr:hypothetical protein LOTGIDRAFT_232428 [Lottia gigantea]ESO94163.1 hypothetical protein LOTGIDRAFT_232428 [Lottia gigantea]